jgi:hypothetical protein
MLRVGNVPSSPHNSVVLETKAHLGLNLGLGSASSKLLNGLNCKSKVKTTEREGVRARSMACSISRVEGHAGALGWGLGRVTSESIIHRDLHK